MFLSVVDTGSFVAGGRAFGLSRSTAGKAVARLEARYGTRLLNRTTRALDLTEEGRRLYQHGQTITAAIEAADASLSGDSGEPSGTMRITAPDAFGRRLLLPVVQRYLERWPKVQIDLSFTDRVDTLVEEGFDLAIRIGVTSPDSSLIARTILTEEPVLCAAPAYLNLQGRPAAAENLGRHDVLQFSSRGDRQGWNLQEANGEWVRAQGRTRLRIDSAEALRDAALAGMGIAFLPRFLVEADLSEGRLERILPDVKCVTVPIIALYPHRRLLEPRVRHFIDMLSEDLRRPTVG